MPLPPGFQEDAPSSAPAGKPPSGFQEDGAESFGPAVKNSVRDIFMKPARAAADLGTNPRTMAKALPAVLGTVGAVSPVPMGATMGTVGGRQISNAALRALGHPEDIPSKTQQVLEGAGAAFGDVLPIPAIKKPIYGKMIGDVEEAAGVPGTIKSLPRPGGPAPTGKWINDTFTDLESGNLARDPIMAKQIKDQGKFIFQNNKNVPLTANDNVRLAKIMSWAQDTLNDPALVPGRGAISDAMSSSLAPQRTIENLVKAVPKPVKTVLKYVAAGAGLEGAFRAVGGSRH